MTAPTNDRREVLAAVLAEHWSYEPRKDFDGWLCECGALILGGNEGDLDIAMQTHVAAALDAALAQETGACKHLPIYKDCLAQEGERGGAAVAGLRECSDYLAAMDGAGGGVYTPDFRNGFRHALDMLSAAAEPTAEGHVSPMVREAARQALNLRDRIAGDQP